MLAESLKRYKIYEYIRDNNKITADMSNTKKLIIKLMQNDKEIEEYVVRKTLEEKVEVQEAKIGRHFHKNMTKREILVNEISQYIYWATILAVSKNIPYEEFNEEEKISEILKQIDVTKIGEEKAITVKEVIAHDLKQMEAKDYLKSII